MNDWIRRAERALSSAQPNWNTYFQYLRIGAEAGDPNAMYQLGLWLLEGKCSDQGRTVLRRDPEAAATILERALGHGYTDALHALAWCYDEGEGVCADKPRAISLYRRAVRAGSTGSAVNLAVCYRQIGNVRGYRRWIERAADWGETEAILQFAEWRLNHRTSQKEKDKGAWSLRALIRRIRSAPSPESFYADDLPCAERLLRSLSGSGR